MTIWSCQEVTFPHNYKIVEYPTECSGPPHLLGPWGWAGHSVVANWVVGKRLLGHALLIQ
jgi:hypothetical protein